MDHDGELTRAFAELADLRQRQDALEATLTLKLDGFGARLSEQSMRLANVTEGGTFTHNDVVLLRESVRKLRDELARQQAPSGLGRGGLP